MNDVIRAILALAEMDRELLRLSKRLKAGPEELRRQQEKQEAARAKRMEAEKAIQEKLMAVDRCALDLRTLEGELNDLQEKLLIIKNNKEYRILTDRIKHLKQAISEKESEELEAMEEVDRLRENLKEKTAALAAEEQALAKLEEELKKEAESIRAQAAELKQRREEQRALLARLDERAVEIYEDALRRGKGEAIARMVDGICQSCFRRQSPNVENIVLVGRDLKQCRCASCGKILFVMHD